MDNRNYYVSGNTANGFLNKLDSNIAKVDQVIVLKHTSETTKTTILKWIIDTYDPTNTLEILKSALGSRYLDGVIIRNKSVAIVTDKISAELEPTNVTELDLTVILSEARANIDIEDREKVRTFTAQAHQNFATGLKIHDDLEDIYIKEMNFEKANELANNLIKDLLKDTEEKQNKGLVYHRFFGTNTADGVVNEVPHLIEHIANVHFIKGRAGTGKSTFMKKIGEACAKQGFDVELYHCSFDPNSLDMVLVRELDFCIFDSTDPHEYFPTRAGEVIIDLYEKTVTPGTDEKFADQINEINSHYKSYMKKGIQDLQKAGEHVEKIEQQFNYSDQDIATAVDLVKAKIAE